MAKRYKELELQADRMARTNPWFFNRRVISDEETGDPVKLGKHHKEIHREISRSQRLGLLGPPEFGKTWQFVIGRALFELGYNAMRMNGIPRLRVAVGANTLEQAEASVGSIQNLIETSARARKIFPVLVPGFPWKSHLAWLRSPVRLRSPHLRAFGWFGSILGGRIDLLLLDDVDDFDSTRTHAQRKKMFDWFQRVVVGRLTRHSRVVAMGQTFHREDFLHRLESELGWKVIRTPIYRVDPETGERVAAWPERWPLSRCDEKRKEYTPAEWDRSALCIARADDDKRFDVEWIQWCKLRGKGRSFFYDLEVVPLGCFTVTGVDLGFGRKQGSGLCAIVTLLVYPNGDLRLLWLESGRWKGPHLLAKILHTQKRYQSTVYVESNGAQILLYDFAPEDSDVPVYPFNTGANKHHPTYGVEGIALKLFQRRFIFPDQGPPELLEELRELEAEMDVYSPGEHTGDRLMAFWFACEGARYGGRRIPQVGARSIDFDEGGVMIHETPSHNGYHQNGGDLPVIEGYENGEDPEGEDYESGWADSHSEGSNGVHGDGQDE